jgi:hypothetical protein
MGITSYREIICYCDGLGHDGAPMGFRGLDEPDCIEKAEQAGWKIDKGKNPKVHKVGKYLATCPDCLAKVRAAAKAKRQAKV